MDAMEEMAKQLPAGIGYEWTGQSYEERLSGSQAPMLYALSLLVVFLCLAALYESWSIPLSVILVVPLGILGALLATKLRGFPEGDPLNRVLWLDFVTYLPDNLLVKVDRGTMLASIEARAPFLDRRVLELVLPAPSALKVRGFTTKAILKQAARGLVPANVIRRRKRGLSVPVARWLNAGLAPLADRYLAAPHLAPDRVRPLLAEHRAGRANHARKLWPVLMAELWAERWHVDMDPLRVG